jgi:hypothetical protein
MLFGCTNAAPTVAPSLCRSSVSVFAYVRGCVDLCFCVKSRHWFLFRFCVPMMSPFPRRHPSKKQQKQFLFRLEDAVLVRCDHSTPWTKGIVAGTSGELLVLSADSSLGASSLQVQPQVITRERDSSYLIAFNLFKREKGRERKGSPVILYI